MSGTLIALIILTAIIGGYLIDYQKNKLKWQSKNEKRGRELDEMRMFIQHLKKRIENLEAIVTDESFDARQPPETEPFRGMESYQSIKDEHEKAASKKAKQKVNSDGYD